MIRKNRRTMFNFYILNYSLFSFAAFLNFIINHLSISFSSHSNQNIINKLLYNWPFADFGNNSDNTAPPEQPPSDHNRRPKKMQTNPPNIHHTASPQNRPSSTNLPANPRRTGHHSPLHSDRIQLTKVRLPHRTPHTSQRPLRRTF